MSESPTPPAGWFVNPEDESELRYWDGAGWTALRRVRAPDGPPPVPYGAAPAAPPNQQVAVRPLLAAGAFLILAGIGRAVSSLLSYDAYAVSTAAAVAEVVGWTGAFVAFLVAGYPNRAASTRAVTGILAGLYGLGGSLTVAITGSGAAPRAFALVALIGLLTFAFGIAFAVAGVRSRALVTRLRVLPLALYLGLIAFGLLGAVANFAVVAGGPLPVTAGVIAVGASGLAPLVVGALVIAFGREPYAATS